MGRHSDVESFVSNASAFVEKMNLKVNKGEQVRAEEKKKKSEGLDRRSTIWSRMVEDPS